MLQTSRTMRHALRPVFRSSVLPSFQHSCSGPEVSIGGPFVLGVYGRLLEVRGEILRTGNTETTSLCFQRIIAGSVTVTAK